MFKKNLKGLSLLLILLVLMIGAIGAVSATDAIDVGNSNITIGDVSEVDAIQDLEELDTASSELGEVEVVIETEGRSTQSYGGVYVPDGTPIISDEIKFNGNLYLEEGTPLEHVTVADSELDYDDDEGVYRGTLVITGAESLVNGTVYYAGIIVPAGAEAEYIIDAENTIVSTVKEETILYIPVTYVSLYEIEITDEPEEIDYKGVISYNGTVTENTETSIPEGAGIRVIFTNIEDDDVVFRIDEEDITFELGEFVIDKVKTVLDENDEAVDLPAGAYVVSVELYKDDKVYASVESGLVVNGVNVTLTAEVDEPVADFDDPSELTVTIGDKTLNPKFIISAINQDTGITYDMPEVELEDGEGTIDMTYVDEETQSSDNLLPVGTYLVTVRASQENYNFDPVTFSYTVEAAETEIIADPNPVYVVDDADAAINFKVATENNPDLDVAPSTITVVLRDEDGNAIRSLKVDDEGLITVDSKFIEDGYYVSIVYAGESGFEASSVNVPLYVREGTEMETDPVIAKFNYGEEGPVVNITLKDGFGEDASTLKLNTTVSVSIDGVPIDTEVTLTDGVGELNLTDLGLDAGEYNITFSYVDEDDVYMPCEAIVPVEVYPIQSYILNVDEDEFTYNVNSNDTVDFYLTLSTNRTVIADYTGNLSYYRGEDIVVYTIPVVDGVASIPVSDLEGLVYVDENPITYTFFVDGNEISNEVDVDVTIELLDGEIFTENVTAYEGTGFIIDGFVSNVSGGRVSVALMDDIEDDPFAVVFADVDEETGYFAASFGGLPEGNYTAGFMYYGEDATIPAANEIIAVADVIVSGEAPEPTNVSYATVLTIDPFNETEGAGKSLVGRLTLEDGTPVIGMHILLNLTRVSDGASKVYTTTTDYNGEFQFPINLGAGEYTAQATFEGVTIPSTDVTYNATESPVTPFSVTKNGTEPTNETTVVIIPTPYVGTYGTPGNFTVKFLLDGEPIVGIPGIEITLTRLSSGASKTYSWFVTDFNGEINMPIELGAGDYTAHIKFNSRTEPYVIDGAEADTTITVKAAA